MLKEKVPVLHSLDMDESDDFDDFPFDKFIRTNVRDSHRHDTADTDRPDGRHNLLLSIITQSVSDLLIQAPVFREGMKPSAGLTYTRKIRLQEWRTNRDEARTWLLDEHDPEGHSAFSFDWCCQMLGRDSAEARERISARLTCPLPVLEVA